MSNFEFLELHKVEEEEEGEEEGEERNDLFFNFRIVQYNILAQNLVNRNKCHEYLPKPQRRLKYRTKNILKELRSLNGDILCFQEMDYFKENWERKLKRLGYNLIFDFSEKNPLKNKCLWGLCIGFSGEKFDLVEKRKLKFFDVTKAEDNCKLEKVELSFSHHIALIVVLKCKLRPTNQKDHYVIVSNVHLYSNRYFGWVRMRHLIRLQEEMNLLCEKYGKENVSSFSIGDFNTSPNDNPYVLFARSRNIEEVIEKQKSDEGGKCYFSFPQKAKELFLMQQKEIGGNEDVDLEEMFEEELRIREGCKVKRLDYFKQITPMWKSAYAEYLLHDKEFPRRCERYFNEPGYTHYIQTYKSTLDYIFLVHGKEKCKILRILKLPHLKGPIPDAIHSSDHVCLSCDVRIML